MKTKIPRHSSNEPYRQVQISRSRSHDRFIIQRFPWCSFWWAGLSLEQRRHRFHMGASCPKVAPPKPPSHHKEPGPNALLGFLFRSWWIIWTARETGFRLPYGSSTSGRFAMNNALWVVIDSRRIPPTCSRTAYGCILFFPPWGRESWYGFDCAQAVSHVWGSI